MWFVCLVGINRHIYHVFFGLTDLEKINYFLNHRVKFPLILFGITYFNGTWKFDNW